MATVKSYEIDLKQMRQERKSLYLSLEEKGIIIPDRRGRNHSDYVRELKQLLAEESNNGTNKHSKAC